MTPKLITALAARGMIYILAPRHRNTLLPHDLMRKLGNPQEKLGNPQQKLGHPYCIEAYRGCIEASERLYRGCIEA